VITTEPSSPRFADFSDDSSSPEVAHGSDTQRSAAGEDMVGEGERLGDRDGVGVAVPTAAAAGDTCVLTPGAATVLGAGPRVRWATPPVVSPAPTAPANHRAMVRPAGDPDSVPADDL